jgi:chaperone LolA
VNGRVARHAFSRIAIGVALIAGAAPVSAQTIVTDSLLDRAARAVAAARPIRANFEQTLTNPDVKQTRTARGEFVQQGPSKFAFRFSDPAGDAIVADGVAIWVYLPSSARGQALKLPIAQGAQLDLITQLLTAPRSSYSIVERPGEEISARAVSEFVLTPKVANTPFTKATLWIDREDAVIRQLEAVETSGLIRRIRFTSIRTDGDLPKDALTFVVPAGVKVIDASALMGGIKPPR